jgi:malonyl-CoA O-methyltransferase
MNTSDDNSLLNLRDVRRRFDRAASTFDAVDFVHAATREGLLARLSPILIEAKTVVDIGCATGAGSRALCRQFRRAHIISVDLSHRMLRQAQRKRARFSRSSFVQANATTLPLAGQSVDLVFANLLLPWVGDPATLFGEVSRVLRNDGLFVFSALGPDSLKELQRAWQGIDRGAHVNRFLDMHDIGDAAVRSGLRDPVLDVDRLRVSYERPQALFDDLTAMGGRNSLQNRRRSLLGRARFGAMTAALAEAGTLTFDLELIYGHCWGSGARQGRSETRIDAMQIGRRGR